LQFFKQTRISGRKIAGVQFGSRNPLEGEATEWLRLVLGAATAIELEADGFFRILVSEALDQFTNDDFDTQFLPKLAIGPHKIVRFQMPWLAIEFFFD